MWKSIEAVTIGHLPTTHDDTITIPLPEKETIPDSAQEILIYVWIASGETQPKAKGHFRISVSLDAREDVEAVGDEAYFCLFFHSYPNNAVAYNSENVWLPMPKDRELKVKFTGSPLTLGKHVVSGIEVLAYKT